MTHSRLSAGMQGFHWDWSESPRLERSWWPVVHSAAELLTSPHLLERLGQCADPQCGWLFLDSNKNLFLNFFVNCVSFEFCKNANSR